MSIKLTKDTKVRGGQICIDSKNDVWMPRYGVGTWLIKEQEHVTQVIDASFAEGIRFIDTAIAYGNHKQIAKALAELLPKHKLSRQDVFITTKLPPMHLGQGAAREALVTALKDLELDCVDLVLIHWPGASGAGATAEDKTKRYGAWADMTQLQKEGKIRSIGVSNFEVPHLRAMLDDDNITVKPAVNQCEMHPQYPNSEVLDFCKAHNIAFQAYSSLGSHVGAGNLLDDKTVVSIAAKHNVTAAQVLYAYSLARSDTVLPRTTKASRVPENVKSLDVKLSADEVAALTALGASSEAKYCWDPRKIA